MQPDWFDYDREDVEYDRSFGCLVILYLQLVSRPNFNPGSFKIRLIFRYNNTGKKVQMIISKL